MVVLFYGGRDGEFWWLQQWRVASLYIFESVSVYFFRYPGIFTQWVKLFAIWGFWRCLWRWLYCSLCGHVTEYLPGVCIWLSRIFCRIFLEGKLVTEVCLNTWDDGRKEQTNFYGVLSYRSQEEICKHWRNVREKRGNMVHPAPKASVKNYVAQMAEIIFTFIAHVVWF